MSTSCTKCNSENPDNQKFCGDCGAKLDTSENISMTKTLKTLERSQTIAGKYKLLEEVGRGGMGIVYKAKDTRLDRTVALKFLSEELTKDEESKQRFILEAKAAAALNHPRICTIYEIEEADSQSFIAMEYIDGQTLKDKLKSGPQEIDKMKHIAIQIAEGLKEAHDKGIIHRDIKPANIMLTEKGEIKITDFGLAKLSWSADLTKPSTILGTAAYMSPEQARSEEVDHRTDIWALGAMLYEMISGDRPFQKSREQAMIFAILNDKPTPLSLLRSDIPAQIEQVVNKALEKKVSQRYQNIQDMIQDLKLSINLPKTEKSIVVLPFDDMSPNKDNEYFSDGLTEEIISDLSSIHDLLVISRSSAMTYKGTKKKVKEIGEELSVQYVLEGTVRKAGKYAEKALALNPISSHAYGLMGAIHEQRGNILEAAKNLKRAVEINPNNTEALMMLSFVYAIAGKGYAAHPITEHLMNIDSFTPSNHFSPIFLHMSEGQFDLALKSCRRAYELDSQNPAILFCTSWTLAFNKLSDELQKIVELMNKNCPDTVLTATAQSLQYALQGKKQKTHETITPDFISLAQSDHIFSYVLADCYALIGENKKSLDWLKTAVKNGRIDYPFISEYDPLLENIRKEPRFKKFMHHVKQEWKNFEV